MTTTFTNEPRGFQPDGRILSTHVYAASGTTAIYVGDMVAMNSVGKITVAAGGGTQLMGVAVSYKPATTTTVLIYDDPDQQYLVQDNGSGSTTLGTTHVGNNFDLVATAANTTLLKSQHTLLRGGTSVTQITATANLRLLGIVGGTGTYSQCRVVINEHHYAKKTGGI